MGRVRGDLILAIFVFGGEDFGRLDGGAIDVAIEASAQYLGSGLSFPENVVRPGKWFRGVVIEGGGDGSA